MRIPSVIPDLYLLFMIFIEKNGFYKPNFFIWNCKQLYCNSSFSHCYPPNFRHEKRHSVYTECPYTKSSYILIYARTHYIYYNINYNICISFYYNTKINPSALPYRGVPWDILTWTPLLSLCKYYIINHVIWQYLTCFIIWCVNSFIYHPFHLLLHLNFLFFAIPTGTYYLRHRLLHLFPQPKKHVENKKEKSSS